MLLTGRCLWFNTEKGFGFVTVDGEDEDLFVHHKDIYANGFQSLEEGEPVEFFRSKDASGRLQATDVTGPDGTYVRGAPRAESTEDMFLTGTCKWFNVKKRFGFIDVNGYDEDIFCHYRDIHAAPGVEATLAEGEFLEFRRAVGPEGKLRAVDVTGPDGAYVQGREPVTSGRLTGSCRWFDLSKGYGFINVDGEDEDAFVHHLDIRAAGLQSLAHAEKNLEFKCIRDPNGRKKAIEVTGKNGAFVRGAPRVAAKEWNSVWNAAGWVWTGQSARVAANGEVSAMEKWASEVVTEPD